MTDHIVMSERKRIALVAHNNKKTELIDCLKQYSPLLAQHELYGTGITGSLVEKELNLTVTKLRSGPMGRDQQLGAMVASQKLDILLFLIDPLDSHPHNVDVQALLRLAQVWGIACATTATSIDFILTSPIMNESHTRHVYSTSVIPTSVKGQGKSTVQLQSRRVPVMSDKSKFILPQVSTTRRFLLPHQTVFKKC